MLTEFIENTIWIQEYPITYAGCHLTARMTVVWLASGHLLLHSPCEIDGTCKAAINKLGTVDFIVAPGSYHYFYVDSARAAFPDAEVFICPGIELKQPQLEFDWLLGDRPDQRLESDFDQVLVRGNRLMW